MLGDVNTPRSTAYLKRALADLTPAQADVLLCVEMMCQNVLADSRIVAYGAEKFCQMYRFAAIAKREQYADTVRRLADAYVAHGVDERYATPRVVLDSLVRDYTDYMGDKGVSDVCSENILLHIHLRTGTPDTLGPRHRAVAEFYAARAGRAVDDVIPDDAAESEAWTSATLKTIAKPVVLCERVFSVLYAATAEYLGNYCRNDVAGKDLNADMWLAEYSGVVWKFPPRAENGEWFVSVSDAVYAGLDAVADTVPPIETYPIGIRIRGWYIGWQDYAPDALTHKVAVDHLVVRAGQMIVQLQSGGVRV